MERVLNRESEWKKFTAVQQKFQRGRSDLKREKDEKLTAVQESGDKHTESQHQTKSKGREQERDDEMRKRREPVGGREREMLTGGENVNGWRGEWEVVTGMRLGLLLHMGGGYEDQKGVRVMEGWEEVREASWGWEKHTEWRRKSLWQNSASSTFFFGWLGLGFWGTRAWTSQDGLGPQRSVMTILKQFECWNGKLTVNYFFSLIYLYF